MDGIKVVARSRDACSITIENAYSDTPYTMELSIDRTKKEVYLYTSQKISQLTHKIVGEWVVESIIGGVHTRASFGEIHRLSWSIHSWI